MRLESLAQLEGKGGVGAIGHGTLLVEQVEQARPSPAQLRPRVDEVEARLVVIEVYMRPRQALLGVLSLLAPEHVGVELLLQPLVGEVDAQLLGGGSGG